MDRGDIKWSITQEELNHINYLQARVSNAFDKAAVVDAKAQFGILNNLVSGVLTISTTDSDAR